MSDFKEVQGQGHGSIFRVCHTHLKNANLLHSSLVADVSFFSATVNENENSSALKGATFILLKVLLFQLSGRGNPKNDTMPSFISDFNTCILLLSNKVLFVSG